MINKIILISLYKNDYEIIKENVALSCPINFYDNAKEAVETLEENIDNSIILLSTLIEDMSYEDVVEQVVIKSKNCKVIVYSSFSSIEEVTKGLEKGVYDFIIGDDVLSKVVMSVNSLFQKSETSAYKIDNAKIQQPINSNLFEMIDYYQVQSKSSELNETIAQYNKWYDNSLKAMEKSSLLIVEDEHIFRKLLVDMVSTCYSQVTAVEGGKEAVEKLKEKKYGIAIVDLFLNDMDGVELIQIIKSYNPLIQIIVVTAFDLIDTASNVLKIGVADYLQKPIMKKDLLTSIEKAEIENKKAIIQEKALQEFFCKQINFEQKCVILESLFKFKKENNKSFIMEDVYQVFPNLNNNNIYEKITLPPIIDKENIKRFISSFKLDEK